MLVGKRLFKRRQVVNDCDEIHDASGTKNVVNGESVGKF